MFRSMETVVAMLYNRCETATFAKIKQAVQDMTHKYVDAGRGGLQGRTSGLRPSLVSVPHRRFEESHVARIKTVFPEAYVFRQDRDVPPFSSGAQRGGYQLTVEPSLGPGRDPAPRDRPRLCGLSELTVCVCCPPDQTEDRPLLSASRLVERRRIFNLNLFAIVRNHHKVGGGRSDPPGGLWGI